MAAGAGFIEFSTGDILTASAANSYLASQVVMVFADASARTSAIASPQEGMISYLKDTNSTEYYSGSAWAAIGGTSGSMTLLSTTTCNSGTTTQTVSSISGSYKALRIIVKNVKMASTGASWSFRLNGDSGSNYMYGYVGQYWGGSDAGVNLSTSVPLGIRNSNSTTWSKQGYAVFDIYNYNATGQAQVLWKAINQDGGGGATYTYTSGEAIYNASSAVSSFSLLADTNFSDGTILVYGVN